MNIRSRAPRIGHLTCGLPLRNISFFVSLLPLTGCRRSPSIGLYGSYFPGWLICLALGILMTVVVHLVLRRLDYEVHLRPIGLVYISLAIVMTTFLWLLLFY